MVYHLHFHKCGGGNLQKLAWENSETPMSRLLPPKDRARNYDIGLQYMLGWAAFPPPLCRLPAPDQQPDVLPNRSVGIAPLLERVRGLQAAGVSFLSSENWSPAPFGPAALFKQVATLVTVLRAPVQRAISSYHFHNPGCERHAAVPRTFASRLASAGKSCPSLLKFAADERNMYARILAGQPYRPYDSAKSTQHRAVLPPRWAELQGVGPTGRRLRPVLKEVHQRATQCAKQYVEGPPDEALTLRSALAGLEAFDLVLTLERWGHESLCMLAKQLGWSNQHTMKPSAHSQRPATLDNATMAPLRRLFELDEEVYQSAARREARDMLRNGCAAS